MALGNIPGMVVTLLAAVSTVLGNTLAMEAPFVQVANMVRGSILEMVVMLLAAVSTVLGNTLAMEAPFVQGVD